METQSTEVQELRYDKVIDLAQERFTRMAPKGINCDAEKGFAVQQLSTNDYLMKVAMNDKASLVQAITNVAAIGLSLNPAKKQAFLVPRGGRVCLDPSYMGMCDMATSSGAVEWLQANAVYSLDSFTDNGPGEKPTHQYQAMKPLSERGEFAGVYCVAKTHTGDYLTTVMLKEEVDSVKGRSELGKKGSGPWSTDYNEMAKKTVVRRAFKMLPKSESLDRMALAVELSNQNEEFEPLVSSPNVGTYSEDQKMYFDQLIEKHDAVGMFLLAQSHKDDGVWDALFNSFEKGGITKYKQIVRDLEAKGAAQLMDCVAAINEAKDDAAILEITETASDDELNYYLENCTEEAAATIKEMQ